MKSMKLLLNVVLCSVSAFAADPFLGNWKVTSRYVNSPWQEIVYEAVSPDSYRVTIRLQDSERRTMLARLDGKDYSNDSDGRDFEKDSKLPAGSGTFTIQWQRIDEHHQLLVFKKNGQEYSRRDTSVSPDGKLLTLRQWGLGRSDGKPFDFTVVFEKQ
jgi:hypothetical protein